MFAGGGRMKAAIIYGGMKGKDGLLNSIVSIISETLKELHVEVEEILLDNYHIDYYYGKSNKDIQQIANKINDSAGVIFVSNTILAAPSGIIKVFLENLGHLSYKNMIEGKYGFSVCFTDSLGERESAEYILKAWEMLGGIEGGKIALWVKDMEGLKNLRESIEKRVEAFYKIFRQPGQKIPNSYNQSVTMTVNEKKISGWTVPKIDLDEINKQNNQEETVQVKNSSFEDFSKVQEKDIKELTDFFKQQMFSAGNELAINAYGTYAKPSARPVVEHRKTCKQMTKNLPHYFQPHLAADFVGSFQFNITGKESFDGYIVIDKGECSYFDGIKEDADITMIMEEDIWVDILRGKISAQKAFMTGQLKVRGNFVLLNRLDQLFKKMS